jgi:Peptidase family U32
MKAKAALTRLGVPQAAVVPSSGARFPDGAAFRIEIPSVEGPRVLETVIRAAEDENVIVNRVSQGSGAMLLRTSELVEMAELGRSSGIEVSLFVGPREGFDITAHSRTPDGSAHFGQVRGSRGLAYAVEDIARAVECGIRSFLIADLGLLRVVVDMQRAGELPGDVVWKISVMMAPSNPASARLLEELGATTVNVPSDITTAQLLELRTAIDLPIDLYVESPDSLGGVVRGNELGDLVAAGAPLYAKFGLRHSQPLYPAGAHLVDAACAIAREKVHRAAVALEWLARLRPDLTQSGPGAPGLGVPVAWAHRQESDPIRLGHLVPNQEEEHIA